MRAEPAARFSHPLLPEKEGSFTLYVRQTHGWEADALEGNWFGRHRLATAPSPRQNSPVATLRPSELAAVPRTMPRRPTVSVVRRRLPDTIYYSFADWLPLIITAFFFFFFFTRNTTLNTDNYGRIKVMLILAIQFKITYGYSKSQSVHRKRDKIFNVCK